MKSRRRYGMAYLTAHRCSPPEALRIAADAGYDAVGFRPFPNGPAAAYQPLIEDGALLRETLSVQKDTGVGVFDLEIVRLDADFDPSRWQRLYELGARLGARSLLVAADDADAARLADSYARLCEAAAPYRLSADLEFMPWTAVKSAREALGVVVRAGQPSNAGILVDALHVGRSRSSWDDLRAIPRALLHHVQLCDAEPGRHFTDEQLIHTARCERLMPGEGGIDLRQLLDAMPEDLPVTVEVVHHARESATSPRDWAAACLMATRRLCEGH